MSPSSCCWATGAARRGRGAGPCPQGWPRCRGAYGTAPGDRPGQGDSRGAGEGAEAGWAAGDIEGQGCRAGTSVYPTHPTPGFTCFGLPLAPTPRRGHDGTRGQPGPGADGGGWWRGAARCPQGQQHRDTRIWGSHGAGAGQHQHGGGSGTRPWRGTGWPTPALRGALVGPLGSPGASGTAPAPTAPTLPVSPVPAPRQRGGPVPAGGLAAPLRPVPAVFAFFPGKRTSNCSMGGGVPGAA